MCRLITSLPVPPDTDGLATGSLYTSAPAGSVTLADPPKVSATGAASVAVPLDCAPTVAASKVTGVVPWALDSSIRTWPLPAVVVAMISRSVVSPIDPPAGLMAASIGPAYPPVQADPAGPCPAATGLVPIAMTWSTLAEVVHECVPVRRLTGVTGSVMDDNVSAG